MGQNEIDDLDSLISRLFEGDAAALSRCITLVERDEACVPQLCAAIEPRLGNARVIGITGPPGVGKSTLTAALIDEMRIRGKSVGVIAIDPTSPVHGGAVLGDRIRMQNHDVDTGVFVRSLASRGQLGGLAPAARRAVDLLDAAGREIILVETVGVGQSEVDITTLVDTTVVVSAPGLGDDIQTLKGGVLEVANILVVNKSDLPNTAQAVAQLQAMIGRRTIDRQAVAIVTTQANRGNGIAELLDACLKHQRPKRARRVESVRDQLRDMAARLIGTRLESATEAQLREWLDQIQRGNGDETEIIRRLFDDK